MSRLVGNSISSRSFVTLVWPEHGLFSSSTIDTDIPHELLSPCFQNLLLLGSHFSITWYSDSINLSFVFLAVFVFLPMDYFESWFISTKLHVVLVHTHLVNKWLHFPGTLGFFLLFMHTHTLTFFSPSFLHLSLPPSISHNISWEIPHLLQTDPRDHAQIIGDDREFNEIFNPWKAAGSDLYSGCQIRSHPNQ